MTFLEESDGTPTVEIHVDASAVDNMDMKCRGGKEKHLTYSVVNTVSILFNRVELLYHTFCNLYKLKPQ